EDDTKLAMLRPRLHGERSKRVRPGLDDKVLADWNGLMIAALADAGALLDEPSWIAMARRAFAFVADTMARHDRLRHSRPALPPAPPPTPRPPPAPHQPPEAPPSPAPRAPGHPPPARHYSNPDPAGYYLTADDAEGLIVRPSSTMDDAIPNPNGIAAHNLCR